jgi:hypothetical protein
MRFEFRTLTKAISTLVVLCVLVLGVSVDVSAKDKGRRWGRGHDRGRHLGWTRGRRVGHHRRDDDDRSRWRRLVRRDRRRDRRLDRRFDRRSSWDGSRDWQRSRFRQSSGWRTRY